MKRIYSLLAILFTVFTFSVTKTNANFELPQIGSLEEKTNYADYSKDGRTILTSNPEGNAADIKIWSASTGSLISELPISVSNAKANYSEDGSTILVGGFYDSPTSSDYNAIKILQYNTKTGKLIQELVSHYEKSVNSVRNVIFNKDETVAYVMTKYTVFFFDLTTGQLIDKVTYGEPIRNIAYNAKENHLLVNYKQQLNILNGQTAEYIRNIELPKSGYYNSDTEIILSPDFTELYITGGYQGLVILDLTNNYKPIVLGELDYQGLGYSKSVALSPNGKYLAIGNYQNLTFYNTETRKKVTDINYDGNGFIYNLAFNKDGKRLLVDKFILDATVLEKNELKKIEIQSDFNIVNLDTDRSFKVVGVNNKDEYVEVNQSSVEWSVEDENILLRYYGSFYGNREGVTTLTATYKGFEAKMKIIVIKPFYDVPTSHTNFEAITYMRTINIINGYEDQTFRPNNAIPRHHIAAIVGRSGIALPVTRGMKKFVDVPTNHPNYTNIQKLYSAGILDGNGEFFNPTNNITHIQLAKILTNIFDFEKESLKSYTFSDIKASHWGYSYAEIMVSNGVMPVYNGSFNANSPVTRAQFAQYFYNALVVTQQKIQN